MTSEADKLIIDTIAKSRENNVVNFSILVQLPNDESKSKALLLDRIKHIKENIFSLHGVDCWSTKEFYSYNDKEKATYFHAILFCKLKRN